MADMTREQWAMAYAEVNSDQETSGTEMDAAYQHGLAVYDRAMTDPNDPNAPSCAGCGKPRMLTWADLPAGPCCVGCVGEWLTSGRWYSEGPEDE